MSTLILSVYRHHFVAHLATKYCNKLRWNYLIHLAEGAIMYTGCEYDCTVQNCHTTAKPRFLTKRNRGRPFGIHFVTLAAMVHFALWLASLDWLCSAWPHIACHFSTHYFTHGSPCDKWLLSNWIKGMYKVFENYWAS
jgi:hypothetical protein